MSSVYLEHRDQYHVPCAASASEIQLALGRAAEALLDCDALLITAGAGMGVDSGLPDYRDGKTGLWKDRDVPMTYEDMSDDKFFKEDPLFAWGSNYVRIEMYRATPVHAGFGVLLKWANIIEKPYYVFTSNVDCHFKKAGFPAEKVVTCHGDLNHLQCVDRTCRGLQKDRSDEVWSNECIPSGLNESIDQGALRFKEATPLEEPYFHCPRCGKLARPNVWFCHDRNYVPSEERMRKRDKYGEWLAKLKDASANVVVIECGGGMAIPGVRVESEDVVDECGPGSLLVRLNPKDCNVPAEKAVGLPLGSCQALQLIDEKLQEVQAVRAGSGSKPRRKSPAGAGSRTPGPDGKASYPKAKAKAAPCGKSKAKVAP